MSCNFTPVHSSTHFQSPRQNHTPPPPTSNHLVVWKLLVSCMIPSCTPITPPPFVPRAFAVVETIESVYAIEQNQTLTFTLSSQQLISCDSSPGLAGCKGGVLKAAFDSLENASQGALLRKMYLGKLIGIFRLL